ncbi:type I 3-dehydroquinate dehydratase [Geobacillus proteiniphilus]|uniref:3-dehydroquinate dehydratase n=1 Tax=Geobacillus proteiniphilus TaxID=860353 RepID=A0A1Q5T5D4_9BACL|nr:MULTISPECIES: type I 3-dehydroquinate dehydratase [Geobacillus]OKO95441.1 3-dehydroquinate dehydratase I [Geobacillus proteiniphilus]OPX03864.1 3-dehydroquinate dehydratase [Geobacillus sp. LEMMY01]TLS34105.1 type I 3-dehydroquinate dehydratase [Geobacillus thermoleovorans]WMJ17546.1 type I 3-dehydroquinate dehydratase [Geobacillus proteiniphilus]
MNISLKAIKVRNTWIGGNEPCICAPVVGADAEQVLREAAEVCRKQPDLLEWRADFFRAIDDQERVLATANGLRNIAGEIPILFTIRSEREGGQPIPLNEAEVRRLIEAICRSGAIDLVDYELAYGERIADVRRMTEECGVWLVVSRHYFDGTPRKETLLADMRQAERYGADIAKVAVMPKSPEDVLVLLQATEEARRELAIPLITMAMGGLGAITRLAGWLFGSAVTFAVGNQSSAPGQIPIDDVRTVLSILQTYSR